jgi:hypothetical protein
MPDETVDPVQAQEAQGGSDTGVAPYQEWLDRIPEDARGTAEEAFKAFDAQTTRKFQEQAEAQRRWAPYEEAGVQQLSPEQIQGYRQFEEALNNPQAIQEWYQQYAQQNGLTVAEAAQQAPPPEEFGSYTDPGLEDVLQKQLGPIQQQLQQMSAWREQQEQQARQQEADQYVRSEFDRLKKDNPDDFDEALVTRLVAQYQTTDPRNAVSRAFADSQAIISQLEKKVLQQKVNQPASAESGGVADGAPESIKTLERAKEVALVRLREGRQ